MNYFKEYMFSVCVIVLLTSVISEILVDFSWSKYINLICGVLFAVCLANPVLDLFNVDFSFENSYETNTIDENYVDDKIRTEFAAKFSRELQNDIESTFGKEVEIKGELTQDGAIGIYFSSPIKEEIYDYIKEKYKPDIIRILGEQK